MGAGQETEGPAVSLSPWLRVTGFSVWLVFLLYPIGDLVHGRIRGVRAAIAWAGLALFVALYELIVWQFPWSQPSIRRRLTGLLAAFAALTVGLVFAFGADWIGLLIYLSVATGAVLAPRHSLIAIPAITVVSLVASATLHVGVASTAFLSFMTVAIGGMIVAWRQTWLLVSELRAARAEVARLAVSEERLRISRDLHDLLGHSLSVIVLKSQLARRLAERDPQAAAKEVREIEDVARRSLVDVREAVTGYRTQRLADELDDARSALAAAGIDPVVRVSGGSLGAGVESVVGWAVREGVTNVVRHSGARRCEISVARRDGEVVVEVRDDGRGPGPSPHAGSGLPGLSERLARAGGTLEAGPGEGGGFRLVATVPAA
ncbi:MAG TPA: sensor histidine kinase [Actinomycetota bacterium]|jgi:two-component system sensor histidine kinase DesK